MQAAARHLAGAPLERGEELEAHSSALRGRPLLVAAQLAGRAGPAIPGDPAAASLRSPLPNTWPLQLPIIGARRSLGRVALPVDELLAAGIEDADLTAAEPPPHLQSYLEGLRGRAAQLFADAAAECCRRPSERSCAMC